MRIRRLTWHNNPFLGKQAVDAVGRLKMPRCRDQNLNPGIETTDILKRSNMTLTTTSIRKICSQT
ncbi:hypothetical protein A6X21_07625 [Planctopirus hydrillae]|uniref:Uncharacterized protein n=1 Tax=Planctopirus hydrillae TaxID=1841610 RepID=A0A1C3E938_9PLAN|nr:hypothetical protein A6X21_07625 [Planctopirus hydrillae]